MVGNLITSGFPRSGNTFLNYALKSIYFPEEKVNNVHHTLLTIEENTKVIVPYRHPLDCIASWYLHREGDDLYQDIKYYLRFHNGVLDNLNKVILLDFNIFTNDLSYVKTVLKNEYGINPVVDCTIKDIKESMSDGHKKYNLPQGNKEKLDSVKQKLLQIKEFQNTVELYNKINMLTKGE